MMGLFARLYLDEDVSVRLTATLQARGFDVLSTLQAGNLAATDLAQLEFAAREDRVLLTHNRRDFERLAQDFFAAGRSHAGLIIAARRPLRELATRVLHIVNSQTADELRNQVVYI